MGAKDETKTKKQNEYLNWNSMKHYQPSIQNILFANIYQSFVILW
jgi:hypothetical protein